MFGGAKKLPNMHLMQKSPLFKLGLGGDKCGDNFHMSNVFVKASTPSVCVGDSSK